jgi:hypothetical protein
MLRLAMSFIVAAGVVTFSNSAFGADPTQVDFDACNREAQTKVGAGHAPSSSGGTGHTTTSPSQGVTSGGATETSKESPSGAAGSVAGTSKSVRGMSSAGQNNPAYQEAYRECMKSRGFAGL